MLWKLQYTTRERLAHAGGFAAALRQHLQFVPAGLTSVLVQIKEEQSAYLLQPGCSGCATARCLPGCRVDLLRRVLRVGYPQSELVLVKSGLMRQPYTRTVVAWPGAQAQPLDASVLQGWTHARLLLHWRRRWWPRHGQPGLQAGVVLQVGAGVDDPRDRLRTIGWHGVVLSRVPGYLQQRIHRAASWTERHWATDPYLLTPVAAATRWLMTPPVPPSARLSFEAAASYTNAATIVEHLEEAGGRVEMLDLVPGGWTARVAATTPDAGDPAMVWETLRAVDGPVAVRDAAHGTVVLDPAQARLNGVTPPLLHLGMRPDGSWRWRPISGTHHLVLSGAIESEMIGGMVAPMIHARPDLRIGVLDLADDGALALGLDELPGRLVTEDSRNPYELLGAIGGLADVDQPVLVIVRAETAAPVEAAALLVLRAALYRPLSLLLVVPSVEAIPLSLLGRCPRITVRERDAQWQMPEGRWEWAHPTMLRLPWRDARLRWSPMPGATGRHTVSLPPLEGFWAVPFELEQVLASSPVAAQEPADEELPSVEAALRSRTERAERTSAAPEPAGLPHPPRRCRVYPLPAAAPPAEPRGVPDAPVPATRAPARDDHVPRPPVPAGGAASGGVMDGSPSPASSIAQRDAAVPADPAVAEYGAYLPQEDSAGNLVIDQRLLILTLQWAEQIDPENEGVSITRFKSGVGLPSKAHSFQLRTALREHGLIRRELKKEGWYRLLTVEEAVRAGKLPPGPWYSPPAGDGGAPAVPLADTSLASSQSHETAPAVSVASPCGTEEAVNHATTSVQQSEGLA